MRRSKIRKDDTLIRTIKSLIKKGYIRQQTIKGIGCKYYLIEYATHTQQKEYRHEQGNPMEGETPTPLMGEHLPHKQGTTNTMINTTENTIYTQNFEEFYSLYPNPFNKAQTLKNWKSTLKNETNENIMKSTRNYIKYLTDNNIQRQYMVRSTNFVGQNQEYRGYLDYKATDNNSSNNYFDMTGL